VNWRLRVWDDDGASNERTYEVPGSPEARITSLTWDVARGGRCLTCSWEGLPQELDISARDVVQVQTRASALDSWEDRWLGYVTECPNANSDDVGQYQAVGLYQRFYEVNARLVNSSGDVGGIVRTNMQPVTGSFLAYRPGGVVAGSGGIDSPDVGFEVGVQTAVLQSIGELLDGFAELVGQFVVPVSETYDYDGSTFNAGDLVPGVVWGVTASGVLFFRRPTESVGSVNEDDVDTLVRWLNETGEEFYNVVRLAFPFGYDRDLLKRAAVISTLNAGPDGAISSAAEALEARAMLFSYGPGVTGAAGARSERLVVLENPLDLMMEGTVSIAANSDWDNLSNADDGDITTYASPKAASVPSPRDYATRVDETVATALEITVTEPNASTPPAYRTPHGLWMLRYATDEAIPVVHQHGGNLQYVISETGDATVAFAEMSVSVVLENLYELPSANTDANIIVSQVYLPSTNPAGALLREANNSTYRELILVGVTGTRLYDVRYYVPDQDACSLYARAFLKEVNRAASEVSLVGHQPLWTDVTITKSVGSATEDARVERTEYRLTVEEGAVTVLHVGSAYDSEAEAAQVLLERVIARVARRERLT